MAGVSHEGDEFFYANPLTSYPYVSPYERFSGITSDEHYRRQEWFFCPCCPPNVARIVASIGGYFYSSTHDRLYVHLYNQNTADFEFNETSVTLQQQTNYPWDGDIRLRITTENPVTFELALRIPGWCRSYMLTVNGEAQSRSPKNGYVVIAREWSDGDEVVFTLDMLVERIAPHPAIRQDVGHIALQRGPIIYCLEEVDNGAKLANVTIPPESELRAGFDPDLFGGASIICGDAVRVEPIEWPEGLYQPQSVVNYARSHFEFKAIPYYLWANR